MSPERARLVELARSFDECGMSSDPQRYLDLLTGGFEDPRMRACMGMMSGCALVVRGLWRAAGIAHPILEHPYRIGRAVADLIEIAAEANGLWEGRAVPVFENGDVAIVGGPGAGGVEHVWTIVDDTGDGYPDRETCLFTGLDGGQRDEHGRECIRVVQHEITGRPPRDGARLVRWLIDYGAVWRRFGQRAA